MTFPTAAWCRLHTGADILGDDVAQVIAARRMQTVMLIGQCLNRNVPTRTNTSMQYKILEQDFDHIAQYLEDPSLGFKVTRGAVSGANGLHTLATISWGKV